MIDQLITALSKEVEMSAEEIADTIWLALQMQEFQAESISSGFPHATEDESGINKPESQPDQETLPKTEPKTSELKETPNQLPEEKKTGIYPRTQQQISKSLDLSFKVPDAPSLREPLNLARALKPLMRRIPSGRELVLDEAATIQQIADEGLWIPVLRPTVEAWLDVELVVDEAISMQFWRHTIRDLERLLKNYGIFRDVRVWGLSTDENEQVQIRRGIGATAKNQTPRSPKELIDPSGRRLVLVVSDCVSTFWCNGGITPVLELWAKQGSMAIVQMLPKWLWKRTALGRASEVRLQGLTAGVFNQKLIAKEVSLWDELDEQRGVKIPVFTLEPDKVVTWAQMLSGKGSIWTLGYVFKLDAPVKKETGLFNLAHGELSAEQRVQAFRVTASPMARKLAGLLASAPVISLPIVRLIRETILRDSQQVHVAEVFLGGLLKPLSEINTDTNPDYVQYEFIDGVRELLVDSVPSNCVLNVVDEVSNFVANKVGLSLSDFVAILRNPKQVEDSNIAKEVGYFARVTAQVLRHLGGEYARFADSLETHDLEAHRELLQPTTPLPNIDWQAVSQAMLEEQLRLTTNPLTSGEGISYRTEQVYVPLGLVERKRQTRRREDVPPEQGSLLYEETEITRRFEHEQFLEQVLWQGQSPKSGGKRLAIIGEPGAGKTTLLQQIAQWVSEQVEGAIAILVSLADLRGQELEPYLLERWLQAVARKLGQAEASPQFKDAFVAQFQPGRVWLLLDGVDEMQVSSGNPLAEISRQVRMGGLLSQARIVLTCRLNLWDGDRNGLDTFDTYRTLEFSYPQQVEQFIRQWFAGERLEGRAEQLCAALKAPGKERIRDLVKNPLRLMLLCSIWYRWEGTLPETKAGLYKQFVADFYEWHRKQFPTTAEQRSRLNAALAELAKEAIDKELTRFRLRHDFVREFLGERDEPDSLFELALQLGWLNKVGVEVENPRKAVYAFFHPTFQEYFAALAISEKELDYTQLRNLLAHQNWKEADEETARLMFKISRREKEKWLRVEDIERFPSNDLRTIDRLWVKYSNGRFGFSVQKRIYQSLGGTKEFNQEITKAFWEKVGLIVNDQPYWSQYDNLIFNLSAPLGHLPIKYDVETPSGVLGVVECLLSRPDLVFQELENKLPDTLQRFTFITPTVNQRGEITKTETNTAQYFAEKLPNDISLEIVAIPGGTFMMGSPVGEGYDSEKPQHQVILQPFFMGKYPVTQAQWRAVANLAKVNRDLNPTPSKIKGNNRPVERVSWDEAVEFCDRLSKYTGRQYRLPSEAEWEYACRAGTTTLFCFGETLTPNLATYGSNRSDWDSIEYNSKNLTSRPKYFNNFGLLDMHGAVWEWCADVWHNNYEGAPIDSSIWMNGNYIQKSFQSRFVVRGGSWGKPLENCRSAYRNSEALDYKSEYNGFRVVCVAGINKNYRKESLEKLLDEIVSENPENLNQ